MAALQAFSSSAVSMRSLHSKLNASLTLARTRTDTYPRRGNHAGHLYVCGSLFLLSSKANYVSLKGTGASLSRSLTIRHVVKRRAGDVRCATMEEIEADKSVIEKGIKERMEKTIEKVRANFDSVRTGRANPSMLDRVQVEYYGSPVSLKSVAQISASDGSSLIVQPYDKSILKVIEKAIVKSDLGLTPSNDGEVIRLSIPQLTSDRRKELSKVVAKQAEEGKVGIRNIRKDAIKAYEKLGKEKKVSEDLVKDWTNDLQKMTNVYIKTIESIQKDKEKEVLSL